MRVALRGSYVEVVYFMGPNENYPLWFQDELHNSIFTDEFRYTFWVPPQQRSVDYHEKELIEDYSVFLRKPNGEVHVTTWDAFDDLYEEFRYDRFTNSGLAALREDCIDYVEVVGGELTTGYPEWFEALFVETINHFHGGETIMIHRSGDASADISLNVGEDSVWVSIDGDTSITSRCVFLQNKFGEVMSMSWDKFLQFYDPYPEY